MEKLSTRLPRHGTEKDKRQDSWTVITCKLFDRSYGEGEDL